MEHFVITIARGFGSGGKEIAFQAGTDVEDSLLRESYPHPGFSNERP